MYVGLAHNHNSLKNIVIIATKMQFSVLKVCG